MNFNSNFVVCENKNKRKEKERKKTTKYYASFAEIKFDALCDCTR